MGFHLFSNSGQIQYGIKNYIADFKTDLKNIPKNPGNMVFVIEESKYYITNNKQDWVEYKINNSTEESDIEIDITENGSHDVSFATIANVNVPQGVFPEGNQIITENGNYDITLKETVDINVPQGIFPSGTKQINLTSNGTTTEDVSEYADAEITVNTLPAKGLVFEDYDSDGYPHSARFVGTWESIPTSSFYLIFNKKYGSSSYSTTTYFQFIDNVSIPYGVNKIEKDAFAGCFALETVFLPESLMTIGESCFSNCARLSEIKFLADIALGTSAFGFCASLKNVIFNGNVTAISRTCFNGATSVMKYDFSHCTAIPPLYSVGSLGHVSGCVIRIPAALSDTTLGEGNGWESATNWSALTDIVWEVV